MRKISSIVVVTLVMLAFLRAMWQIFTSDELRSKPEWSALQNLEYLHRADPVVGLSFGTNEIGRAHV